MNNMNRDHVAISTATAVTWNFIVPSEATTCADQASEMTDICAQLFDAFGDFLTPIGLRYGIAIYSEDREIPYGDGQTEPVEEVVQELRDESGITASDFVTSTHVDYPGVRWIPRVGFDNNQLKIRFKDGDRYVDRSDCVAYVKRNPVNWNPTWDPLEIKVGHVPNRSYEDIDAEYIYRISVGLLSDVWIEQSDLGEINQTYLSAFLNRLAEAIAFKQIKRDVDSMSDLWIDLGIQERSESFDPKKIY